MLSINQYNSQRPRETCLRCDHRPKLCAIRTALKITAPEQVSRLLHELYLFVEKDQMPIPTVEVSKVPSRVAKFTSFNINVCPRKYSRSRNCARTRRARLLRNIAVTSIKFASRNAIVYVKQFNCSRRNVINMERCCTCGISRFPEFCRCRPRRPLY